MMDFSIYARDGMLENPYAGKTSEGEWLVGDICFEFLQREFGSCANLDECVGSTESEGLKLLFEHLKRQQ